MSFDFDTVHDRRAVPALKMHPMVLGADGADLFAAGVADMDFAVAPPIVEALRRRLDHPLFGYEALPDGLIPALCGWLETRHGWQVDPAHILRAPNALNSLAIAAALFTAPGDGILLQPPVFFDFFDVIREAGREPVENPLILKDGRYEMDFDGLERLASHADVRMIFLCNPHNPMGRVWTRGELAQLDSICRRHGVFVVSDELHGDLTLTCGHQPFAALGPEAAANSVTILSPAKTFNIASCCAASTVVADPDRRAAFLAENSRLTVNKNNAFANVAMMAAWTDGAPWLDAALAYLRGNLDLVRTRLAGLDGVELIDPEAGFLAWLDFRGLSLGPEALTAFLRGQARWAVTRGPAFGTGGEGFARLNFACPRSVLAKALDRLEHAVVNSGEPR